MEVVTKFRMGSAKVVSTPFEPGSTLGMEEAMDQARAGMHPHMVDVPFKSKGGASCILLCALVPTLLWLRQHVVGFVKTRSQSSGRLQRGCFGVRYVLQHNLYIILVFHF